MKRTPVKVYRDGREVCDLTTRAGKYEYLHRVGEMWGRQEGLCCLCGHPMGFTDTTFDHEDGRGMGGGKRDDRIEKDGKPYNGAAHLVCNTLKGSRFIDYNKRGVVAIMTDRTETA